ncbi:MAG: hypothetical protein R3Y50_04040 [Rikenellaceae bacterium]
MKRLLLLLSTTATLLSCSENPVQGAIKSIETPYTISSIRDAKIGGNEVIIASSYDGCLLCYDYKGNLKWENKLSGFVNLDIFCGNIDADESDEILVANADGSIYTIDDNGKNLWQFRPNDAPMNAVCTVKKDGKDYIVAGSFDTNFYYLDGDGKVISTVKSNTYSKASIPTKDDVWGGEGALPPAKTHVTNFLRAIPMEDGSEVLAVQGTIHSMARRGEMYLFKPLETMPYDIVEYGKEGRPFGSLSVDCSDKSKPTILMGTSNMLGESVVEVFDVATKSYADTKITDLVDANKMDFFGYRVIQPFATEGNSDYKYVILVGSRILLANEDLKRESTEVLISRFSYNDVVYNKKQNKMLLASAQSGGNCIHIVDLNDENWKEEYQNLQPKGNITSILDSGKEIMGQIEKFEKPAWEDTPRPIVYLLSDGPRKGSYVGKIAEEIHANYPSPVFLSGANTGGSEDPKLWKRDTMSNRFYRVRRESRQKYQNSQEKILRNVKPAYDGDSKGMSMWGGHGNDPYYYSLDTKKKILDFNKHGQQTVLLFPEFETRSEDFAWMLNDMFYPLAQYSREKNSKLYVRSKHAFWFGTIYKPFWYRLTSGEFADVFVPSMEETSDKSMELSLAARVGIWSSGAVDSWGSRGARDNPSYNRLRQHSHQMIPNHFLRMLVLHLSSGSQYLDNFAVNQEYMNILWQMIAKGVLYIPTRDELVSINPVRLNIIDPDDHFLDEGNDVKWISNYSKEREDENIMVFSRLNGTWPGAPVTEWDFSRYAAGVKDRRLNFLPPYSDGLVMLTQPDDATSKYRKPLEDNINSIYKGKMKEFFTDGRNYYSDVNKSQTFGADTYYKEVESAIKEGAKMLPLTVKGQVAWVTAQTAPTHLRLTIVDGGYINPSEKKATINIEAAKVASITNLLTGEKIKVSGDTAEVTVPCGMFLFLDVELSEKL